MQQAIVRTPSYDYRINARVESPVPNRRCSYWKFRDDPQCQKQAAYLLELISREGSRSQVTVFGEHVHKAWEFGQRILACPFPGRKLRLSMIRLMPILETKKSKRTKAAGVDS